MNGGVSSFFSFVLQPNLKTQTDRTMLFVNSDVDAHVTIHIWIYVCINAVVDPNILYVWEFSWDHLFCAFNHGTFEIYVLRAFLVSRDAVAPTKCNGTKKGHSNIHSWNVNKIQSVTCQMLPMKFSNNPTSPALYGHQVTRCFMTSASNAECRPRLHGRV